MDTLSVMDQTPLRDRPKALADRALNRKESGTLKTFKNSFLKIIKYKYII